MDTAYKIILRWTSAVTDADVPALSQGLETSLRTLSKISSLMQRWYVPDGKSTEGTLRNRFYDGTMDQDLLASYNSGSADLSWGISLWNGIDDAGRVNLALRITKARKAMEAGAVIPSSLILSVGKLGLAPVDGVRNTLLKSFANLSRQWRPTYGVVISMEHQNTQHPSTQKSGWMILCTERGRMAEATAQGLTTEDVGCGFICTDGSQSFDSKDVERLNRSSAMAATLLV